MPRSVWLGDNLEMLSSLQDESVQLVYMDPPFASDRDYEAILGSRSNGTGSPVKAFTDRWPEPEPEPAKVAGSLYPALREPPLAAELLAVIRRSDSRMYRYLSMMLPRLLESRRILTESGALFLHCDPSASHYLKVLLDQVFGPENFRNEVIWKRTHAHNGARRFGAVHDSILFYTRGSAYKWNPQYSEYDPNYISKYFRQADAKGAYQLITCTGPGDRPGTRAHYSWKGVLPPAGRHWAWKVEKMAELDAAGLLAYSVNGVPRLKRYVDDSPGVAMQDMWTDINRLDAHSDERVGYDTQKPVELVQRIIMSCTDPGDIVIDPFAGSGTTAVAAERNGRGWHVADNSLLATSYALSRVRQECGLGSVSLHGFPSTASSARLLLRQEPQVFGVWATSLMASVPDRSLATTKLISGKGVVGARRKIDIHSFVPLGSQGREPVPVIRGRRAPSLALTLNIGLSMESLSRAIRSLSNTVELKELSIQSLVDPEVGATGMPADVKATIARELAR